jgi:hypothetical protein
MIRAMRQFFPVTFSLLDRYSDYHPDLPADTKDLDASQVIRDLVSEAYVQTSPKRRIVECNRKRGMLAYVDPLANITHLVSGNNIWASKRSGH